MKKEFDEITGIIKVHNVDSGAHLNKLTEEIGELAQALNKLNGLKSLKKKDTQERVISNIKEEIADCIQILFAISKINGFEFNDIKSEIGLKNKDYKQWADKWVAKQNKKQKIKI